MEQQPLTCNIACGPPDSAGADPETVGNKAANLIRLAKAGLPVPAGFVITTHLCRNYFDGGQRLPGDFATLLSRNLQRLEQATGLGFGKPHRPLLVSVRSGAPVSMPGMMDTVLNVGLCDRTVPPMIRLTGNPRFVWDSYRRLIQSYAEVVGGLPADPFQESLDRMLDRESVSECSRLDGLALRQLRAGVSGRIRGAAR